MHCRLDAIVRLGDLLAQSLQGYITGQRVAWNRPAKGNTCDSGAQLCGSRSPSVSGMTKRCCPKTIPVLPYHTAPTAVPTEAPTEAPESAVRCGGASEWNKNTSKIRVDARHNARTGVTRLIISLSPGGGRTCRTMGRQLKAGLARQGYNGTARHDCTSTST
jgi:hypothetical protein